MAQVVAHDGTRLLLFTRSAPSAMGRPAVAYGRILDLARLVVWPECYLDSLLARPMDAAQRPVPADTLVAMTRPEPLAWRQQTRLGAGGNS